jgi:hypothetical protein
MVRVWLKCSALLLVLVLLGTTAGFAQNNVTFRVKLGSEVYGGKFTLGTDVVTVRGDFNDWGNSTNNPDTLKSYRSSDTSYALTKSLPAGAINYKFWASSTPLTYESIANNRTFTVVAGNDTIPTVWFNDDSSYTKAAKVPVKFQVNMRAAILSGIFIRDTDYVRISGSFNGWSTTLDTMKRNSGDSIYTHFDTLDENSTINYKFLKTLRINSDYESIANRAYTVPHGGGVIPVAYFNNDSLVHTAATGTIKWQVNIAVMKTLGWFDPAKDTMQVRGGFEGWSGTKITQDLFNTNLYTKTIAFGELIGNSMAYKFYMKLDSLHAASIWGADWGGHKDDYNYEHPAPLGDGNDQFLVTGGGTLSTNPTYYSQIPPQGVLGASDSVNVSFKVKMGPAVKYSNPLDLSKDTVKFVLYDRLWRAAMAKNLHLAAIPDVFKMTGPNMTDSSYTVTIKVKGPTHYNMMYFYRVNKSDGTSYDEGGGLGLSNPYRARFIGKNGAAWPATYSAPTDVWQKDAPMPGEASPFPTGIAPVAGVPLVYSLNQNYPNPFNPTTTISYTLPAQSTVSLKVFNVLGQEVETLVNTVQGSGNHIVVFDASRISSGVYFYRLEAGKFTQVMKMMLLK